MKKLLATIFLILITVGTVSAQGQNVKIDAKVMHTEPVPLQAGEYATAWLRITNNGSATASPSVELLENFPFTPTDKKTWNIGELAPGQSYDLRAEVKVSENAVFGENDLKIRKKYASGTSVTESIPLQVRTDDRSLVISSLDFPARVEPGSSATMSMTLENLQNSNFRNIDVKIDTENLPVAPRETSRKRISSLGNGEEATVNFTIDVDPDADNQLVDLPIQIDYQNQAGTELSVTETTGVNIGGYPKIEVGIEETDLTTPGKGTLTLRIVNRGQGEARFTQIQVGESEHTEILSENSIYLGSMIADDYQTAEFEAYVNQEASQLEVPVTVNYRGGNGEVTEEFTVTRELYTASELEKYGLNQQGSILPVIAVLIIVAAGGIYYWKRVRKRE